MSASNSEHTKVSILIALYRDRDEEMLEAMLPDHYEKADRENYAPTNIDLCITDLPSWNQHHDEFTSIRHRQSPLQVPFMLLVSSDNIDKISEDTLKTVDQLLWTPVRKKILRARLENMYHARTQSLELNRYRQAMDQANSGIVLTDNRQPDNPIVYANQTFCDITGYDKEEFEGRNCRFLQQDDRDQEGIEQLKQSVHEGSSCRVTLRNYTKSGRMFWNDLTIAPIQNSEGSTTHFVGVQNDVTSQVEANKRLERLSTVARRTHSGVTITDADKKIQWVNPAFERMTGYVREEMIGQKPGDLLQGPDTSRETIDFMSDKLAAGKGFNTQLLNYRKDGTPFWTELEVRPEYDEEGHLQHWIGINENITDRVKAFQREKQTKQQFYRALEMAPLPVMNINEKGSITFINQAWTRQSGYHHKDIPTVKDWIDKAHQEEAEDASRNIENIFENNSVYHGGEFPVHTKEGEQRIWDFWNANLGTMPGDESTSAIVMAVDVTDLRQTQKQKEAEYHKFNQLFEYAPDAIAMTDEEGRIQQVNKEFERLLGYDGGEVADKIISRLLTRNEEEREGHHRRLQKVKQKKHLVEESVVYDQNDNKRDVLVGKALVEAEGQPTSIFHTFTDTTYYNKLIDENARLLEKEQKLRAQAEESRRVFKDMFEYSPVAIALLETRELRYSYVNQAYKQMFAGKKMAGRPVDDVFPGAADQGYINIMEEVFDTGESYYAEEKEVWFQPPGEDDYQKIYRNMEYVPLEDSDGETYGILIAAVDVTDQVHYREQLQRRLEEKTTLLAEIHHRVKNNLAVISGLLYMQNDQSDNPEAQKQLNDAFGRIQSIALVHEQLYQEAEADAHINIKTYLPKLVDTLQQVSSSKDKTITTSVNAEEAFLPLDQAVSTGLLVTELLINAFKHAFQEREDGNLEITAKNQDDTLQLQVSDDGVGLPEDFSMEESGGMGLQIVSTLLEQLEADMNYDSSPNEGTIFTINIPLDD